MMSRMREWIRGLSFRTEFAIVFFLAFAYPIAGSLRSLYGQQSDAPFFTNAALLHLLFREVVVGSLLWAFLVLRGWTGAQVGLSAARPWGRKFLTTPLLALGIMLACVVCGAILSVVALRVWPDPSLHNFLHNLARQLAAPDLRLTTVLAATLINPVFEEVFVCGYVVSSLRDRLGVANAVTVSAGIRVAYHLYQGPFGAFVKVPAALIFAIWFARTRRLAPLILAHAIMDFAALWAAASSTASHRH